MNDCISYRSTISACFSRRRSHVPNGLVALRFPHFGLHVALGQNVVQAGADDRALELGRLAGLLLRLLFLDTLLVLSSIQHGPGDLTRVALHQMRSFALGVKKREDLSDETNERSTN